MAKSEKDYAREFMIFILIAIVILIIGRAAGWW